MIAWSEKGKTLPRLQEIAFAKKRMELEGRREREPYTKKKFKKILTSWHIYALTVVYMCVLA